MKDIRFKPSKFDNLRTRMLQILTDYRSAKKEADGTEELAKNMVTRNVPTPPSQSFSPGRSRF